jgi:hypothetical protein
LLRPERDKIVVFCAADVTKVLAQEAGLAAYFLGSATIFLWKTAVSAKKASKLHHSKDSVKSGDNKLRKKPGSAAAGRKSVDFCPRIRYFYMFNHTVQSVRFAAPAPVRFALPITVSLEKISWV